MLNLLGADASGTPDVARTSRVVISNGGTALAIWRGLLLAGCLLVGGAALDAAHAASPGPVKNFEQLVAEAEQIFVGTVTATPSRRLPSGAIVSDIEFSSVRGFKGRTGRVVSLLVLGGTVDDESQRVPGLPRFEPGAIYVVFVRGNGRSVFPVVGGPHGVFQVRRDEITEELLVFDAEGRPIADVRLPLSILVQAIRDELAR